MTKELRYFNNQRFVWYSDTPSYQSAKMLGREIHRDGYKYRIIDRTYEVDGFVGGIFVVYRSEELRTKVYIMTKRSLFDERLGK